MTRVVFPKIPEELFRQLASSELVPSTITFVVGPDQVVSPQTGHQWYIQMEHDMSNPRFYSLIPENPIHFRVEERRPRLHCFRFTDAWVTTNHHVFSIGDMEVHISKTLFNPERADDKLYFGRAPFCRMEVLVPDRFIGDREILDALRPALQTEFEIDSLVQRQ